MDVTPCNVNEALDNKVRSTVGINSVFIKTECEIDQIIKKHSFHSFKKLIIVTSYVIRFVMNCKRAINSEDLKIGEISLDEKKHAKLLWLRHEQAYIDDNYLKQLKFNLGAYVDEDGVIKAKGRLENSDLSTNVKFPIIIPKQSDIGEIIIYDAHSEVLDYGTKSTLNQVNSMYWLIQG